MDHTSSQGSWTVFAPRRRRPASFVSGAVSGTIAVHATPTRFAWYARAWAMFPALHVYTPAERRAGWRSSTALPAPRPLNEPVGCRFSSFRWIAAGASSTRRGTRGVRRTVPRIRPRAPSTSDRLGARTIPDPLWPRAGLILALELGHRARLPGPRLGQLPHQHDVVHVREERVELLADRALVVR